MVLIINIWKALTWLLARPTATRLLAYLSACRSVVLFMKVAVYNSY